MTKKIEPSQESAINQIRFTEADAARLIIESASWPLPVFPQGTAAAAIAAIERSEAERLRGGAA